MRRKNSWAGLTLVTRPTAGSLYLNFYYDMGALDPEEVSDAALLLSLLGELDSGCHTAIQLTTLRNTWLGESFVTIDHWVGRQAEKPCIAKFEARASLLERNLDKAVELLGELLYDTRLEGAQAETALARTLEAAQAGFRARFHSERARLCHPAGRPQLFGGYCFGGADRRRGYVPLCVQAAGAAGLGRPCWLGWRRCGTSCCAAAA